MRTVDELDALRARLVDAVRVQPEAVRSAATVPGGGWTAVQVLQHLLLVESLVLSGFDRNYGSDSSDGGVGATSQRTIRDRVGALAVSLIFLLRIRVRIPTRRVDPVPPLSFEEVQERWRTVGPELATRLREAALVAPKRAVMRHPVSGPLSPEGTAAFLLSHMRHHERQLRRILASGEGGPPYRPDQAGGTIRLP